MAEVNVKGFPRMLTEKSLQTKLNNIMFMGVQICNWESLLGNVLIKFSAFSMQTSEWQTVTILNMQFICETSAIFMK